jgi:hypothetical protein
MFATGAKSLPHESVTRVRIYDQALQQALMMVWEAADRICAKRLKQIIPALQGIP